MFRSCENWKLSFRVLLAALGFTQAWAGRFYIDPDGLNYLDVAAAYLRRDWSHALNAYWSPLYPWMLTAVLGIFHPSPYWESTALHLLNFVAFLLAMATFEFFSGKLLVLARSLFPEDDRPEWAWWILTYTAFAVCTLRFITLREDTPDMLLAAVVFLTAGMVCRMVQAQRGTPAYLAFGVLLGLGYLAKSVMLPLSVVYLAIAAFARKGLWKLDAGAVAAVAGFLLLSTPFAAWLSSGRGRVTFGDTGKVAYLHEVLAADEHDSESVARHSSMDPHASKDAVGHQPRKIFPEPPVYFYDTPFPLATFPAWYDPGYWWGGRKPVFSLRLQLAAVRRAAVSYFHMLSTEKQWAAGWLVMAIFSGDWRKICRRVSSLWFVWIGPLAALSLYSLVLAEPRYAAVWVTILWLTMFAAVPWPRSDRARNLGVAVVLAIALTSGMAIAKTATDNLFDVFQKPRHEQWRVAQSLEQMGLRPGDQVAFLGHTTVADYWAHLQRVRVLAIIPLAAMESYWAATPEARAEIAGRLRAENVRALIVTAPPRNSEAWRDVGGTGYYVKFLQ